MISKEIRSIITEIEANANGRDIEDVFISDLKETEDKYIFTLEFHNHLKLNTRYENTEYLKSYVNKFKLDSLT